MASTAKGVRDRCKRLIYNAKERLKQMAHGKSTTAIDTNSDSVYRYGYSSLPDTGMRLLDADAAVEYTTHNNTHDGRSPRSVARRRSGVMLYTPNDTLPNGEPPFADTSGSERAGSIAMAEYTYERDADADAANAAAATAAGGGGTTQVSDSAGSELTANTVVADELARVVWDLSTAAEMSPEQTTENDLQLLQQMADDAKELQRQLMDQLSSYAGDNEEVFAAALASNDALQNVLSSYEDIMMRVTYARQHAAAIARKASVPSGSGVTQASAPAVAVPDLMSFDSGELNANSLQPPSAPPPPSAMVQGTPVTFTPPLSPHPTVNALAEAPTNLQVPIAYQAPSQQQQQQQSYPHNA